MNYFKFKKKDNYRNNKLEYKKRLILVLISILIILLFLEIFLLFFYNLNNGSNELKNIIINNNSYAPKFSSKVHDYYLLTNDKEINIKCKVNKNVETIGCDEKIDLTNYSNYIHEIIINKGNKKNIYKIYIKVKEFDNEENISIDSIDGMSSSWTKNDQNIIINASSKNKIKAYSIDNGHTFQQSSLFTVTENSNLKIVVKDEYDNMSPVRQLDINKIDKSKPQVVIIKEGKGDKITLKAIAKDEDSGIDSYSWNDEKYEKNNSYTVSEEGNYYVKVKDRAGNVSDKISIDIKESDFNDEKQYAITLYKNGAQSLSDDFLICSTESDSCSVELSSIERDGAEIIGWSNDKNAKKAKYTIGENIVLDKDTVLYAITKKDVTASFFANGNDSISRNSEKCALYNDDKYCYIKVPSIVAKNKKIIGWNDYQDAKVVLESPKSLMKLYENSDYYALSFKQIMVKFDKNGVEKISSNKEYCNLQTTDEVCSIKTPSITNKDYETIGWSVNNNDTNADILERQELQVSEDITLYAITKKSMEIKFDKNGADSVSEEKIICNVYNTIKNCEITTPKIYRKNASIMGWSSKGDEKSGEIDENSTIVVDKNETFYAITSKKVTANFWENGADSISNSSSSCTFYNDAEGCRIKTPTIKRASWNIIGWNKNKNATKATVMVDSDIKIDDDIDYYAITSKKLTANILKNNADSLGSCQKKTSQGCSASCNLYNLNESCEVSLPYIYSKGNEVQFFSTSKDPSTTVGYSPANKLKLLDDIELNAIVDNRYRNNTYSITKTKNYGYTAIETEAGCPANVYNNYYNFLDKVYVKAPYLFKAAKVTFTSNATFNRTWGNYSGMTYGIAIGYRNVDIKCPDKYSTYYNHTLVHELTHAWDSYYKAIYKTSMSDMNDFKSLYNKYSKATKKPLRSYAYTNMMEFVADVYAWYYFLYIDNSNQPDIIKKNPYFPKDMKLVVEKYIRISKNGFS